MKSSKSGFLAKVVSSLFLAIGISHADESLLKIGSTAPVFSLVSQSGDSISLKDFALKKYVVLIFYPGDETPVCTQQLCAIRDDFSKFSQRNAVVFGINGANGSSHKKFADKNSLQFPLLIDVNSHVTKAYGAAGTIMAKRTVYVIDPKGKIVFAQRGKPANEEILKSIPLPVAAAQ